MTDTISSYPILLGRPWLYLAKAEGDGTITIGKGEQNITLPMYPTIYRGETQTTGSEFSSEIIEDSLGYEIDTWQSQKSQK